MSLLEMVQIVCWSLFWWIHKNAQNTEARVYTRASIAIFNLCYNFNCKTLLRRWLF